MISGTLQEYSSGTVLSGFTVTVGQVPNAATCLNTESATSMPCGIPSSPLPTATTSSAGAFVVAVPSAGTYMLTIGKDVTYATLHRTVTVASGGVELGVLKVAALSADEQAWVADINTQRATVSVPISFGNLVVDEYAEEQARAEAAAIAGATEPYDDATEELFVANYFASPGAIYGASGVADLVGSAGAFLTADAQWMAEKTNCPGGNWQTCTFAANTGHYINVSSTENVWIGVGESGSSLNDPPFGSQWAYAAIIPGDNALIVPASRSRVASALSPNR